MTVSIPNQDWRTIILLGVIHASSHFFQLILPTLFFYLHADFGYDYVQLGFLVTCFFVVSGLGQASSGFLVDRSGPALVMFFGLAAFVVSALMLALAPNYAWLVAAALLGGAGNAIFHPVDYSIINHQISPSRLGHAYSIHGLTGYVGWALAPLFITTLSAAYGWRVAMYAVAALMLFILILAIGQRRLWGAGAAKTAQPLQPSSRASAVGLLLRPTLWGAFFFFAFSLMALSAVQNYTIPSFSTSLYNLSQLTAGSVLSAYMIAAAVGMAAGGFLVGATAKTERIIFVALCLAAFCMSVIALQVVGAAVAVLFLVAAGVLSGLAAPSRDMLVRSVTPKGATGAVYGLVYSGMDVGAATAPMAFGYLVDQGLGAGPWYGAAIALLVSAVLAVAVAYAAQKSTDIV